MQRCTKHKYQGITVVFFLMMIFIGNFMQEVDFQMIQQFILYT